MQRTRHNIILILLLLIASNTMGQRFINLTADEVTIDSVMPVISYALPLPSDYSDSIYTAEILYPEFLDMDDDDIARYNRIASRPAVAHTGKRCWRCVSATHHSPGYSRVTEKAGDAFHADPCRIQRRALPFPRQLHAEDNVKTC